MAGAHVFPGGRVDEADRTARPHARFLLDPPRFADLRPTEELAYRVAAARELEEEASVRVGVDDLIPMGHWVTPEIEIRRYDTRFFLTLMPPGQEARHDDGEVTELVWLTPDEAVARALRRELQLPPPTWITLRQLGRQPTLAGALEWARRTPVIRLQPGFLEIDDQKLLTLPGDPTFPAIDGWDAPEETRFRLEKGGGWLPARP
jgi:8-oxo-dGTP pyrophosphatase MutT (NUDIX family)